MLPDPPSSSRLILGDPGADSGGEGKSKSFLRAIVFCPFRLSLAPTICPWVSEDARASGARKLPRLVLKSGYGPGYIHFFSVVAQFDKVY